MTPISRTNARSERRRGGRIACRSLRSNFGPVLDVSSGGARVRCASFKCFYKGRPVVLRFQSLTGRLSLRAQTVRLRRTKNGYEAAFLFPILSDDRHETLREVAGFCVKRMPG